MNGGTDTPHRSNSFPALKMPVSDQGSGTVMMLGICMLALMCVAVLGLWGEAAVARHRAAAAADLAALSAAGTRSCSRAAGITSRNRAVLVRCQIGPGGESEVTVMIRLSFGRTEVRARAGVIRDVAGSKPSR
jgi:secretion/DNA translocation related TadE-like protein